MMLTPLRSTRSGGLLAQGAAIDPLMGMHREMNRMFDDAFRGLGMPAAMPRGGREAPILLVPSMDATETDNELRITVEMPGVSAQDVSVEANDDVLTMRGEKRLEKKEDRENAHFAERAYGTFQRSLLLPFRVDPQQVQARFDNGVLSIVLPKPKEQQITHRINVQSGTQSAAPEAPPGGQPAPSSAAA